MTQEQVNLTPIEQTYVNDKIAAILKATAGKPLSNLSMLAETFQKLARAATAKGEQVKLKDGSTLNPAVLLAMADRLIKHYNSGFRS